MFVNEQSREFFYCKLKRLSGVSYNEGGRIQEESVKRKILEDGYLMTVWDPGLRGQISFRQKECRLLL